MMPINLKKKSHPKSTEEGRRYLLIESQELLQLIGHVTLCLNHPSPYLLDSILWL